MKSKCQDITPGYGRHLHNAWNCWKPEKASKMMKKMLMAMPF
jgi:hypothetical protein